MMLVAVVAGCVYERAGAVGEPMRGSSREGRVQRAMARVVREGVRRMPENVRGNFRPRGESGTG